MCATWNSVTGSWQLLKNGVIVAAGQDLQRGRTFPSQSSHYIDAGFNSLVFKELVKVYTTFFVIVSS